jgi:branched-subunit amino acid aminotransferase/4-amino-4-deoxychorismate lyase
MSSFVDLMAEREISAGGYWGACLLNERGNIVRTTKGNLYLIVKEGSGLSVLYVDEESGAYTDSLFDMLDHALHKLRYNVRCVKEFTNRDLQNALEAFVLDSSFGVQLVIGIDNERYSDNNLTSDISATFVKTINSIME